MLSSIQHFVVDFCKREDGPTAVEYAVMLALIIVVCLAAITTLGQNANSTFTTVGTKIGSAPSRSGRPGSMAGPGLPGTLTSREAEGLRGLFRVAAKAGW